MLMTAIVSMFGGFFCSFWHNKHTDKSAGKAEAHKAEDRGRVQIPSRDQKADRQKQEHQKAPRHQRRDESV